MIFIENMKTFKGEGIRIDRGTALGNPFFIGKDGNRDEVIEKYRKWLWEKIKSNDKSVIKKLNEIKSKAGQGDIVLLCWCKPLRCHGDIVKACVEWMMKQI